MITTKKIFVEYTQKEIREYKYFSTQKNQLKTKEISNRGNDRQKKLHGI